MAQHYPIKETEEPKLFKELRTVVELINGQWDSFDEFKQVTKWDKNIMRLSDDYMIGDDEPETRIASINPFQLEDQTWDETKDGGLDFTKDAGLEVHFDMYGQILNVYYPL